MIPGSAAYDMTTTAITPTLFPNLYEIMSNQNGHLMDYDHCGTWSPTEGLRELQKNVTESGWERLRDGGLDCVRVFFILGSGPGLRLGGYEVATLIRRFFLSVMVLYVVW